jgi:uncharacterized membrane protein YgcG
VRFALFSLLYLLVGVLVATSVLGDARNYFSGLSTIEELVELILAVLLWPLVLLDVNVSIGDIDIGGGDSGDSGGSGDGGSGGNGSGGGEGGKSSGGGKN